MLNSETQLHAAHAHFLMVEGGSSPGGSVIQVRRNAIMNLDKYTQKAQEAVAQAQQAAQELSHQSIEPAHLLLAGLDDL